jgi:hypothetical protein
MLALVLLMYTKAGEEVDGGGGGLAKFNPPPQAPRSNAKASSSAVTEDLAINRVPSLQA